MTLWAAARLNVVFMVVVNRNYLLCLGGAYLSKKDFLADRPLLVKWALRPNY